MSKGYAIGLSNKFDWNEDSVLMYTTHRCLVILQGQYKIENDVYFVLLNFEGAKSATSASTDCSPSVGIYPENSDVSFICVLTGSNWDNESH